MLVQSHIAVQQRRCAVNALLRRLVLYGNNVAVAVGLYACVRQAPFQDGVVVVYDLVRLQVRAQHLHRQGQGFRTLYAAYHVKALHLHFFHKVPCGIAVIIYPRREQVVFADGFAEPLRYVGIADSITVAQALGFMLILPLYLGYQVIVNKTLSAGDFVATFNGAYSIAISLNFLMVWASAVFSERAKMIEKYREFLKSDFKIKDGKSTAEITEPKTITVKNMSFTYPGNDKPTLKNINLEIKPYEKIALVGFNGAGKTTLTNLLLRLYDVTDGEILIDGENIKDVTVGSHRARFAAVFQDFQTFACSVGENVALDEKTDPEKVRRALKHSGFTKPLKNGVDTELLREFDDNGAMLSGGEAQKIAIARAFYRECPYVILDEPSANLDPIAEYNLNRAMTEASEHKTVIFISHRLSTTVIADRIYVMENGEIIESGSHEELMNRGGTYAKMFTLQAEKYEA